MSTGVRLLRTANHAQGRLWLRVDRGEASGFFDNMARDPVISEAWADAEITGGVDADATAIVFGQLMRGAGTAWYDDLELAAEGKDGAWHPIEIQDGGFEAPDPLRSWHPGTGRAGRYQSIEGWNVTTDHDRPASGASSLRIEAATKVVTEELFDTAPAPGETVDIDLGSGLRSRVPISLYSKDGHTIGDDPGAALHTQAAPPPSSPTTSASFDMVAGVADVIVVWNVLEHFWPYWNVVPVDWNAELDRALVSALADHNVDDHIVTLQRLTAATPDGHASTSCPGETETAFPPFAVDLAEGQVVVIASADPAIERGDVIVSVDGRPAAEVLAAEEALISGSPQWKMVRGLAQFARGAPRTASSWAACSARACVASTGSSEKPAHHATTSREPRGCVPPSMPWGWPTWQPTSGSRA